MSDQPKNQPQNQPRKPDQSLREISHLFLSSIRDKATAGNSRPQRTPPAPVSAADTIVAPATAVVAAHLNGEQRQRVREYAAHLCKTGERVGLIELDADHCRLTCFELGSAADCQTSSLDELDPRKLTETLEEMSWDVDRWLVNVVNVRLPEARELLRQINRWTVLATCDHDGIVACYRSLKGLAELHHGTAASGTLALALLDAADDDEAQRTFQKLHDVCQQFLHWPLEREAPVLAAGCFAEFEALHSRSLLAGGEIAAHWEIVAKFLSTSHAKTPAQSKSELSATARPRPAAPTSAASGSVISQNPSPVSAPVSVPISAPAIRISGEPNSAEQNLTQGCEEVVELPAGADHPAAIALATMHSEAGFVECPVKPPMLGEAILAVARDCRLVLFAVAQNGLSDLRKIGQAWQWMNENRALIAMAVPQLSIDAHQSPRLRLLVDRADASAELLQPLMQSGHVSVQTYRKLKWGEKLGVLLEAA